MIQRKQKKGRWKIPVAVVALALLACGLLISLAVRKVSVEEKVEQKFSSGKNMPRPTPKFPPLEQSDN